MGDNSLIEWTDATWNPIRARNIETEGIGHFCVHASEGCRNCYAERLQPRFKNRIRFAAQDRDKVEIFLDEKVLTQPLRWKRPRQIFVCSMTDLFGDWVTDDMLDRIFAVMALCPQHTFQVLTKRPERMREYVSNPEVRMRIWEAGEKLACEGAFDPDKADLRNLQFDKAVWPLPNVWLGVSVEDQKTADQRIPILLDTPGAIRFISAEPLLGPLDLAKWIHEIPASGDRSTGHCGGLMSRIDWIVAGGESGPKARPSHPEWFRSLRDQCAAADVPFLFKQWGEWADLGSELTVLTVDVGEGLARYRMIRLGKKAAGRQLDGLEHNARPTVLA